MTATAPAVGFLLLLGLGFFFGLAFEEFYAKAVRPGGVRSFPLLALAGGLLYRLDPIRLLPLAAGLLVLGAWLTCYYWRHIDEEDRGLAAPPLFLSLRAAIRAHVTALACGGACQPEAAADARRYLGEASAALRPVPPRLIAIGGLSGTGKSTLAAGLAPALGLRPGARVLRSDVIRKRIFGLDPEARLPESAYRTAVTARVYGALRDQARAALHAGYCAIIEAVALAPAERAAFAAVARETGAPFAGLWLEASGETVMTRAGARNLDASDATPEVVKRQLRADPGPLDWHRIDAGNRPQDTSAAARTALGL